MWQTLLCIFGTVLVGGLFLVIELIAGGEGE